MNTYYLYVILDETKHGPFVYGKLQFEYEPFYIGIGKGNRYQQHFTSKDKNHHKHNRIRVITQILNRLPLVQLLYQNISHSSACRLEKLFIRTIGRSDLNTGPLTNLTSGGEGSINRKCHDITRTKISNSKKGHQPWNKGLTILDNRVRSYTIKRIGQKRTKDTCERMSVQAQIRSQNPTYIQQFIEKMSSEKVCQKRSLTTKRNGSKSKENNPRWKNIDPLKIKELVLSNTPQRLIAKHLNISITTVERKIRELKNAKLL